MSRAIEKIQRSNGVLMKFGNKIQLLTGDKISLKQFDKLLRDGLIVGNGDAWFGVDSQTYRISKKDNE